ncbi:MAG: helical backbone metal receptor [Anaerolineae bacterium]
MLNDKRMNDGSSGDVITDVRGRVFPLDSPARRIVSLAPSITETLFDFGCADRLIGRTDYCVHPAETSRVPSLGGTKNPDLDAIRSLQPDLVFANQEENRKAGVDALEASGIPVFLTFPRSVSQAIEDLDKIAALLDVSPTAREIILPIRKMARNLRSHVRPFVSVFVPIWRDPWMTFNAETFAHDLLSVLGLHNVFADRNRRYPLAADLDRAEPKSVDGRDTRYPRVTLEEIAARRPQRVLLPDEPYVFGQSDADEVARALDLPGERVWLIDGSLLFWHGTRMRRALADLPTIVYGLPIAPEHNLR